jgi:hypothetical protein
MRPKSAYKVILLSRENFCFLLFSISQNICKTPTVRLPKIECLNLNCETEIWPAEAAPAQRTCLRLLLKQPFNECRKCRHVASAKSRRKQQRQFISTGQSMAWAQLTMAMMT